MSGPRKLPAPGFSGRTLIPTGGLRFALRYQNVDQNGVSQRREVRILQMRLLAAGGEEVWQDVPTVDQRGQVDQRGLADG